VLPLAPDELLSTTRSVRRRLDLSRPVEREVIEECLHLAQQAPTASNSQRWHFVIVTDADKRLALAEIYRESWAGYRSRAEANLSTLSAGQARTWPRVLDSAQYLADHFHEVPVHVLPCISPRPDTAGHAMQAAIYASIIPAAWSFLLAARARGLGGSWTTLHLSGERRAAELLGIPYETVAQVALIPVAYTKGADFKPAPREPLVPMVHWDNW
jgi:nitroreductase